MVLKKSVPVPENHKKRWDKFVNPALNNALKQEEATWEMYKVKFHKH